VSKLFQPAIGLDPAINAFSNADDPPIGSPHARK